MNTRRLAISAVALSALVAAAASAADKPMTDKMDTAAKEKCYGVAVAGKNGCARKRGRNNASTNPATVMPMVSHRAAIAPRSSLP